MAKKAARASTRISFPLRSKPIMADMPEDQAGFTMIELMVVITIIALMSFLILPSIGGYFRVSVDSATRDLASTIKEAYNSALATGRVHRIAYNINKREYWVESCLGSLLLDTEASLEKEERRRRRSSRSNDEKPPASPCARDKSVSRKVGKLPTGVEFEDIVPPHVKEPLTEGMAYTHIFPHGMTEQTIIHLTNEGKTHVSLVVSPLVGQTDVYARYVSPQEAFGEK